MKEHKSSGFEAYASYGSTTTNIVGSGESISGSKSYKEEERPVTFATNYSDPEGKRRKKVMSDTWKPHLQIMGHPSIKVETYLAYRKHKGELIINVWSDSINKEENIYIELYDWNVCPVLNEHNKRTLYCLPYPINKSKYPLSHTGKAYTVPVSDLVVFATMEQETDVNKLPSQEDFLCGQVNNDAAMHNYNSDGPMLKKYKPSALTPPPETSEPFTSKIEDEIVSLHKHLFTVKDDANIKELTIKDVFAMLRGVPVSDKEWLNELIKNN